MHKDVRLAKARVSAFARTSHDRVEVAKSVGNPETKSRMKMVVDPPNMSKTLRNVGVVLLVTPDPFSGIPGAALLGASYAVKGREAANLASLSSEAARVARMIRDLQSLL
ncbi:MAG: hypothetical protein OK441_03415 [Thaumarchaeota archaeon]|nr:hypothetical protein [Nitrososphaerota archaeon]